MKFTKSIFLQTLLIELNFQAYKPYIIKIVIIIIIIIIIVIIIIIISFMQGIYTYIYSWDKPSP